MKPILRLTFFVSFLFAAQLASAELQCYDEWIPDPNSNGNNHPDQYPGSYVEHCYDDGQDEVDEVEIVGIRDNDTYAYEDVLLPNDYFEQDSERPEPIWNPADRPKPQMCYTIELDKSKCEEKAQKDFTTSAEVCPYYAAAAVAGGAAASGLYAYISRSPAATQQLKNYLAIAAGGAIATTAFGDLVYNACRAGFNDDKESALAACKTDAEKKKVECSIYN